MKPRIRSHGIIIFLTVVLICFFPKAVLRMSCGGEAVKSLGLILILLGQLLRVISRGYKAENSGQGKNLIQGGPYSMVRNPMYLGILLIGLGVILFLFNSWAVFPFIFFFMHRYYRLMLSEEKKLGEIFGKQYAEYMRSVPRIFPHLPAIFSEKAPGFFPLKYKWFKREISGMLWVVCAGIAVRLLLDIRSCGAMAALPEAVAFILVLCGYFILTMFLTSQGKE